MRRASRILLVLALLLGAAGLTVKFVWPGQRQDAESGPQSTTSQPSTSPPTAAVVPDLPPGPSPAAPVAESVEATPAPAQPPPPPPEPEPEPALAAAPAPDEADWEESWRLRHRLLEASNLADRSRKGEAAATGQIAERLKHEQDPRVREALEGRASGRALDTLRSGNLPDLPPARGAAKAEGFRMVWTTPPPHEGEYESSVTIDASGRAQVETIEEMGGQRFHVRYPAWAFRDAAGRLVLDARGQKVQTLQGPKGIWSPDSMVFDPGGNVRMVDDRHGKWQGAKVVLIPN